MRTYHKQPGCYRFMTLATDSQRGKALRRGWVRVSREDVRALIPASAFQKLVEAPCGDIMAYSFGRVEFGQVPGRDDKAYMTGESLQYLPVVSPEKRHPGRTTKLF